MEKRKQLSLTQAEKHSYIACRQKWVGYKKAHKWEFEFVEKFHLEYIIYYI